MISQQAESHTSTDCHMSLDGRSGNSSDSTGLACTDAASIMLAAGILAMPSTAIVESFVGNNSEWFATKLHASHSENVETSPNFFRPVYVHGATHVTYTPSASGVDDDTALWRQIAIDLDRWSYFPSGWDGDSAVAPSAGAIHNAMRFRAMLMSHAVSVPQHYIDGDGEIGFRWRNDNKVAVIAFPVDGGVEGYIDDRAANSLSEYVEEDVGIFPLSKFLEDLSRG